VLNFAAAAAFMGVVSSNDATLLPAMRVYYATLSPPLTLTVLAISEPIFRRLFAWLLLIGLSVGLYGLLVWLYYSSRISISDGIMELAGYGLSIVGLAAFGYLLRRGAR
jgi:hypothetical protein